MENTNLIHVEFLTESHRFLQIREVLEGSWLQHLVMSMKDSSFISYQTGLLFNTV